MEIHMQTLKNKKQLSIIMLICILSILVVLVSGFKGQPKSNYESEQSVLHSVKGQLRVSCSYQTSGNSGMSMENQNASEILIFNDFVIIKQVNKSTFIATEKLKYLRWRE
jgi:hypothetical protein